MSKHPGPGPARRGGIDDPERLAVIARLDLRGHLADPDLDAIAASVASACSVPMAVINIVTPDLQTYPAESGVGSACTRVPDALSFCAEVVQTGSELVVVDATTHPTYRNNPLVAAGTVGAFAGVPLQHDGQVIGSVSIFDAAAREFTGAELQILRDQARLAGAVLRLRALTAWDALTGLATRTLLLDRAATALSRVGRGGGRVAVAVLDVVDMSGINEAVGSTNGDLVLRVLAERITAACGPQDSVARIGGDSFAVLFDAVASEEDARARAAAAHTAALGPVSLPEGTVELTVRCGLSTHDGGDADALLAGAERAASRSPSDATTPAVPPGLSPQERELRDALAGGQLVLHYHPVIELLSNRMVGVEALVRWQHPQRGLVPPLEFIPLAESCGLIVELGEWVLRTAAAQAAQWCAQGRSLDVAINLSPHQMGGADFAERVLEVLAEVHAPYERIVLEVTESALLDHSHAAETLAVLRASGVRLALDDFGTGYSSFSYLRRFPVDIIKIDRSFVGGMGVHPDDDAIVASVVSLARNTGKAVVAEGVETSEHLSMLRALGVQSAQGFLWSRPLPVDQVLGWCDALAQGGLAPVPAPRPAPARTGTPPPPASAEAQILHMHGDGASLHTIAAALNAQGRRTATGVRWHVRSVARVVAPVSTDGQVPGDAVPPGAFERDQASSRRDEAADRRDRIADRRDRAAEQRDLAGQRRDTAASERDAEGGRRDQAADQRDGAALMRDAVADDRDRVADERDREALRYRVGDAPGGGRQALLRSGAALRGAAEDREQAQRDRRAGAEERSASGGDRHVALQDRDDGASDRDAAGRDRTTSLGDRGSGASERGGAVDDRGTALADRGASAAEREHASLDALTGVHQRGAGLVELEREIARARRTEQSLVLAFLDVDHLKAVNDAHGHAAGDALLTRVAATLREHLRPYDLVLRFGGDEFVCALTGVDLGEAGRRFGLVHAALTAGPQPSSVTVGVAGLRSDDTIATLMARADADLYRQREQRA